MYVLLHRGSAKTKTDFSFSLTIFDQVKSSNFCKKLHMYMYMLSIMFIKQGTIRSRLVNDKWYIAASVNLKIISQQFCCFLLRNQLLF